jgi:hypothetical protein
LLKSIVLSMICCVGVSVYHTCAQFCDHDGRFTDSYP